VALFAPIVPIAAGDQGSDAREFHERCAEFAEKGGVDRAAVVRRLSGAEREVEWSDVAAELARNPVDVEDVPEGDSDLSDFVMIAPVENGMWVQPNVVAVRERLAAVRVVPFTETAERIAAAEKKKPSGGTGQKRFVVKNVEQFVEYRMAAVGLRSGTAFGQNDS
jgi:hypothetical protein